jgi:hypothetical protein
VHTFGIRQKPTHLQPIWLGSIACSYCISQIIIPEFVSQSGYFVVELINLFAQHIEFVVNVVRSSVQEFPKQVLLNV